MPPRKRKSDPPSNQNLDRPPKRKCTQPEERNPSNAREATDSSGSGPAHRGRADSLGADWGSQVRFEDLERMTEESLRAERISRRHSRALQHYVLQAVKTFKAQNLLSVKKTPEELHRFCTTDSESLPLVHIICQYSLNKPVKDILDFLCKVPDLEVICKKKSATGENAGKQFAQQALKIMGAACECHEHIPVVRAMLKAETEVNAFIGDLLPLMIATKYNNVEAIKLLVKHQASVDLPNSKGETSLLLACRHRQWSAAHVLLDCDANVFHADEQGETAFHAALSGGGVELIHHMEEKSERVSHELQQNVEALIRIGYNASWLNTYLNDLPEPQLHALVPEAIQHRNTAVLQQIAPKLPNQSLATHITEAYRAGHYDCVDVLVMCCRERAELPRPDIALHETCKHRELIHLTCLLVENGADVNEGNGEPIRTAAKYGNLKAVVCLIDNNARTDAADTQGWTPLIYACKENHLDVVNVLLKRTHVYVRGVETPLDVACQQNNVKLLKLIMQNNPTLDLTKANKDGMTLLQVAIENQHYALAMALMAHGAHLTSWSSITLRKLCLLGIPDLVKGFLQDAAVAECEPLDEISVDALISFGDSVVLIDLLTSKKVPKSPEILTYVLRNVCKAGLVDVIETLVHYDKNWRFSTGDFDSHLNYAIRHRQPKAVEKLLQCGCDPSRGNCAITDAIKSKDILSQLLKYDLPEDSLQAALLAACKDDTIRDESCVRLLLEKINDINYHDNEQITPLLAACLKSSVALVKLMLSRGADPNHSDKWQRTPLYVACEMENREIASLLLTNKDNPAKPNLHGIVLEKSPLWISCNQGFLDLVTLLLDEQANAELSVEETSSLISQTHEAKQHEVVRLLLEYGTDPKTLTEIGLKTACQLGYAELALVLYDSESIQYLEECIEAACTKGFPETGLGIVLNIDDIKTQKRCFKVWERKAKQECQHSLSPPSGQPKVREDDPLWQSLLLNDNDQFKKLIAEGLDPNVKNENGTPLLHVAVQRLNVIAVKSLLKCSNTNVNQTDEIGRTALFYAFNNPYIFSQLIENGADLTVVDSFGRTLVHEWKPTADETVIMSKLNLCDDANKTDCKMQTPLHLAVRQQNGIKVRILLEHNSQPNARDVNGISPIELSKRYPDIHGMFAKILPELHKTDVDETNITHDNTSRSVHFSKDYPIEHRVVGALSKIFHEAKCKDSNTLFQQKFETPLVISKHNDFKGELETFCDIIIGFMKDLSEAIQKEDPLFAFTPILSGSCSEGTKVGQMDEADVLCSFTHPDWEKINMSNHEPSDFSYMKLESKELAKQFPKLFNGNTLSVHSVFQRLYSLIRKHVSEVLARYDNLYIVDIQSILANQHAITPLEFIWSGKLFKWQTFSVDVVPAIPVSAGKIPKALKHKELIHDLVVVPKWTAGLIHKKYTDEAFQLGFSWTEKDFFYAMPIALRQGYMLAKVAKDKCVVIDDIPVDNFFSSYMLKCKMFECFSEMPGFCIQIQKSKKRDLFADVLQRPEDVLYWANKILEKLEHSVTEQQLKSYFLPGSNLLAHPMYNEPLALVYVQMCRAIINSPSDNLAPWSRLTKSVAQQLLEPKNRSQDEFKQELTILFEMVPQPNVCCPKGCSLIYYMLERGLEEVQYALTEWQASLENVDGKGNNVIHVAEDKEKWEVVKYLQRNIAVHVAVTVDKKPTFRLPFTADLGVSMNSQGDVILAEKKGSHLYMYTSSHGEFSQRWCRDLPDDIKSGCWKAITSSGQVVMQDIGDSPPTVMIREDGVETRWQNEGMLITCLPPDRLVYAQKTYSDDCEVVIIEQQGERRLRLPQDYTWRSGLSVCASGNHVAVTEGESKTLSVFKHYNHASRVAAKQYTSRCRDDVIYVTDESTVRLGYKPAGWTAVCCNESHVFVIESISCTIHIYTWAVDHTQSLSIDVDLRDRIEGLWYISRDKTLQAAVGRWDDARGYFVHSLLALPVHLKHSPEEMAQQRQHIEEQTKVRRSREEERRKWEEGRRQKEERRREEEHGEVSE